MPHPTLNGKFICRLTQIQSFYLSTSISGNAGLRAMSLVCARTHTLIFVWPLARTKCSISWKKKQRVASNLLRGNASEHMRTCSTGARLCQLCGDYRFSFFQHSRNAISSVVRRWLRALCLASDGGRIFRIVFKMRRQWPTPMHDSTKLTLWPTQIRISFTVIATISEWKTWSELIKLSYQFIYKIGLFNWPFEIFLFAKR